MNKNAIEREDWFDFVNKNAKSICTNSLTMSSAKPAEFDAKLVIWSVRENACREKGVI